MGYRDGAIVYESFTGAVAAASSSSSSSLR
jgi:hypothetical protein